MHYACVRSAVERIKPDKAFLYYEFEPSGPWWELTRKILEPVRIRAPRRIFGNPVAHVAHRTDIVRLEMLTRNGGIYLDADVLIHESFDHLLDNSVVLGEEGVNGANGLANAVILAEPGAPFLKKWYDEFRTFRSKGRDIYWGEHAVRVPFLLSKKYPSELTILPHDAFYWPLWTYDGLHRIYGAEPSADERSHLANHLWESAAWDDFLKHLTPRRVRNIDSNFHRWVRPLVSDLPDSFGGPGLGERLASFVAKGARKAKSRANRVAYRGLKYLEARSVPALGVALPRSYDSYNRRRIFQDVYKQGLWGKDESERFCSGTGSRGIAAQTYVAKISELLKGQIEGQGRSITVVDLGCGDFEIGRELVLRVDSLDYIGCDIVPDLISHHLATNTHQRASFRVLDMVTQELPAGDVCLVRQVFQHLSNAEIKATLKKLKGLAKIYITEAYPAAEAGAVNPDKPTNADVRYDWRTGRGRGVELNEEPFNIPVRELFRVTANPNDVLVTFEIDCHASSK